MIGKKVKWMLIQYSQTGEPDIRYGKVVAEDGDWFVIRADKFGALGLNPFVVKRGADIVVA